MITDISCKYVDENRKEAITPLISLFICMLFIDSYTTYYVQWDSIKGPQILKYGNFSELNQNY